MKQKYTGDKRSEIFTNDEEKFLQSGFDLYQTKRNGKFIPLKVFKFNIVALLLNISDESYKEAKQLYEVLEKCIEFHEDKGDGEYLEYKEGNGFKFFDFVEKYFASIVFAHSAIEAYVNSIIPNNIDIELKDKNGILRRYDIYRIEKLLGLKGKITEVIPKIYKTQINPGKIDFWSDFCELINYRNEIIHPKSDKLILKIDSKGKILQVNSEQIETFNNIFDGGSKKDIVESARKLIGYLARKTKKPEGTPLEFRDFIPLHINTYVNKIKVKIEKITTKL